MDRCRIRLFCMPAIQSTEYSVVHTGLQDTVFCPLLSTLLILTTLYTLDCTCTLYGHDKRRPCPLFHGNVHEFPGINAQTTAINSYKPSLRPTETSNFNSIPPAVVFNEYMNYVFWLILAFPGALYCYSNMYTLYSVSPQSTLNNWPTDTALA